MLFVCVGGTLALTKSYLRARNLSESLIWIKYKKQAQYSAKKNLIGLIASILKNFRLKLLSHMSLQDCQIEFCFYHNTAKRDCKKLYQILLSVYQNLKTLQKWLTVGNWTSFSLPARLLNC